MEFHDRYKLDQKPVKIAMGYGLNLLATGLTYC